MTTIDDTTTLDTVARIRRAASTLDQKLAAVDGALEDGGPLTEPEAGGVRLACVELLEALGAHQALAAPVGLVPADDEPPMPKCGATCHNAFGTWTCGRAPGHAGEHGRYVTAADVRASLDDEASLDDDRPAPEQGMVLRAAHRVQPGDVVQRVCGDPLWHTVAHVEPFHEQQPGHVLERGVAIECEDCPLGEFPRNARLRVKVDDRPVANPASTGHASPEDVTVALGCDQPVGEVAG